jgi:hypothetical protein
MSLKEASEVCEVNWEKYEWMKLPSMLKSQKNNLSVFLLACSRTRDGFSRTKI